MSCKKACVENMNRRISLEKEVRTQDEIGGNSVQWVEISKMWARIEPKTANQIQWSAQLQHRVTHRITVRYARSLILDSSQRIIFDGRIFHIQGFRNVEEQNLLYEIDCEEGKAS